jgi:hypothetical protein
VVNDIRTIAPLKSHVRKVYACEHEYDSTINLKHRLFETIKKTNSELTSWVVISSRYFLLVQGRELGHYYRLS